MWQQPLYLLTYELQKTPLYTVKIKYILLDVIYTDIAIILNKAAEAGEKWTKCD